MREPKYQVGDRVEGVTVCHGFNERYQRGVVLQVELDPWHGAEGDLWNCLVSFESGFSEWFPEESQRLRFWVIT